ncbi:alanine racemase [Nocardioides sp. zg-579]|uniref:Alanine racemase n=1 Tax=Nocardioides marmotae TaxID=2663857 RepID=A0A6I3JAN4_9ACTN|nr:alanine racemase [Nocardioides marmotae]MCR6031396.1 alanine racemase [Gordonia jinghuaiqii]MTB95035.1 alanine racemase [Nocardioides marmotae]QKE02467.1 alanine racemase [Nocardioides marmotae]
MSATCPTVAVPATAARPVLEVDLAAVGANTRLLADRAGGALMAVVKADGFGHGAVDVARTALAHGATWLGVTALAEALPLRAAGLRAPVLSWLNPVGADWAAAVAAEVDVAVPSAEHLTAVAAAPGRARVHLHVDCGMARDGAAPASWSGLCAAARRAERRGLVEVVGVMGHLGCAETPGDTCNTHGRTRFAWALETARAAGLRPEHRHLAATAATLTDPRSHHTMSRVGAGLVGIDPSGTTALRGALTLTAPVVSVRRVPAGSSVGYGHHHRTDRATHLGLVPLGYADGLPRAASGRAEVLVRGARRPLVGLLSMDQAVVDLGERPVAPGETVTLLGPGDAGEPTAADWARWAGTIPHEVLTGLGAATRLGTRLERHVTGAAHLRGLV